MFSRGNLTIESSPNRLVLRSINDNRKGFGAFLLVVFGFMLFEISRDWSWSVLGLAFIAAMLLPGILPKEISTSFYLSDRRLEYRTVTCFGLREKRMLIDFSQVSGLSLSRTAGESTEDWRAFLVLSGGKRLSLVCYDGDQKAYRAPIEQACAATGLRLLPEA